MGSREKRLLFAALIITCGFVFPVQAANYTMTASNISWLNPMWGTPAAAPSAGNDYLMAYVGTTNPGVMRVSPYNTTGNGSTSFPGNSITVPTQCRFLMKQYGGETVTINGGTGNLIVNGGRVSLGGNNPGLAGTVTLNIGQMNVTGNCLLDMNNSASGLLVNGTLTGAGPITLQKEADNTARSFATFANVSGYTGNLTVSTYIDLGFGVDYAFTGTLTMSSGSTLNVNRALSFKSLTVNGKSAAVGTYSGSSLAALNTSLGAAYFVDGGGTLTVGSSKLADLKVVDRDYIMVHLVDGEVKFVDDGLGSDAYTNNKHDKSNNYVVNYGLLNTTSAALAANWVITSTDDANYGTAGKNPLNCYRKTKLSGAAEMDWDSTINDWHYDYTFEHTIYLKLPHSLVQSKNYTLQINPAVNADAAGRPFTFDLFSSRSEAIHLNLVGYLNDSSVKAVDLHHWMGDGGARNYTSFIGNNVYLYNVDTAAVQQVSTVANRIFNDTSKEGHGRNLTGSDVWPADFTGFTTPGTYRVAIDGVGCSEDFEIKKDLYLEPFKISTLGFYYMRIGEGMSMTPVPRQPRYIPNVDPANCKVYITTIHPWHPDWSKVHWDNANSWAPYVKPGSPENNNAWGGHSDALDWDRHLGHVSIIYDMLLPYIMTNGRLQDDNLGILESGNGVPDILDEAQNEVDFWLRLRDGNGYSHGLTNPNSSNVLYQAGNTPMAAWANAMNAAMLADCYRIAGLETLKNQYLASAVEAYNYASGLADPMLSATEDVGEGRFRGEDFKMTAAAYLYNITGDMVYENMLNSLCDITSNTSIVCDGSRNQLYACAAYLMTPRTVHYTTLYNRMKASVIAEAKTKEANNINTRPSRRGTDPSTEWFKTVQNVQRCIVAHAVTGTAADKTLFLNAMVLEADWGLGRNSGNMIYMTTASTSLANKRSIQNAYTSGRDDGTPGMHPGHTPYMNINDWASSGMIGNRPSLLAAMCYPDFKTSWPQDQSDFNNRYVWAHSEFTPQQSMRGKQALYGYLYGLYNYAPADFEPDGDVDLNDLALLMQQWLNTGSLATDLNDDRIVNLADFAVFAKYWMN